MELSTEYYPYPKLVIIQQNSLSVEKYVKNKKAKMVHVVVKNSPFAITLGAAPHNLGPAVPRNEMLKYLTNDRFDLSKVSFDCALLYDLESEKEVDYVTNKPFQFKVQAVPGSENVNLEIRLKVLSSQHEDTFFRVKIVALDPITKSEVSDSLKVITAPIKVISKPEQLKKRRPTKKRTLNDMLVETLTRIEQSQQKQQKFIDKICENTGLNFAAPQITVAPSMGEELQEFTHRQLAPQRENQVPMGAHAEGIGVQGSNAGNDAEMIDFPEAVANLLRKYNALEAGERPAKIQRIIAQQSVPRTDLMEMNDLFMSEGLPREIGNTTSAGQPLVNAECPCTNCPHKAELERIELFYKEMFNLNTHVPT